MFRNWVCLLVVCAGFGCREKIPPDLAARHFFEQIRGGQVRAAYDGAALYFRAQQSLRHFEVAVREIGMTDATAIFCESPKSDGQTTQFSVRLVLKDGRTVPLQVTLNEEAGAWRVFALEPLGELQTGLAGNPFSFARTSRNLTSGFDRGLPSEESLRKLAVASLRDFDSATRTNSYTALYETIAQWWKDQIPIARLKRDLRPWSERRLTLEGLQASDLVLEPAPRFNLLGEILISGYVPRDGGRASFTLTYVYEVPKWWLAGIEVGFEESPGTK